MEVQISLYFFTETLSARKEQEQHDSTSICSGEAVTSPSREEVEIFIHCVARLIKLDSHALRVQTQDNLFVVGFSRKNAFPS